MTERQEKPPWEQAEVKARPGGNCQRGCSLLEVWGFSLPPVAAEPASAPFFQLLAPLCLCNNFPHTSPGKSLKNLVMTLSVVKQMGKWCWICHSKGSWNQCKNLSSFFYFLHLCGVKFSALLNIFIFFQHTTETTHSKTFAWKKLNPSIIKDKSSFLEFSGGEKQGSLF